MTYFWFVRANDGMVKEIDHTIMTLLFVGSQLIVYNVEKTIQNKAFVVKYFTSVY